MDVIGWRNTYLLCTAHLCLLLYFLLFCETHDLVFELISIFEKSMTNCIVKIIDNVLKKMLKVGYFL